MPTSTKRARRGSRTTITESRYGHVRVAGNVGGTGRTQVEVRAGDNTASVLLADQSIARLCAALLAATPSARPLIASLDATWGQAA